MTRVTFLHGAGDRLQAIAAWLRQAHRDGQRVLVYAPRADERERIDRLLWCHPPTGFTPHCSADSELAAETPVVLASALEQTPHDDCLVNLSDDIPPGFGRFAHLIEVVSAEGADKLPGRERFRFYRGRGYPLDARDVSGEAA